MTLRFESARTVLLVAIALFSTAVIAQEEPVEPASIREQFESAAGQIKIFATSDYVSNRDARFVGDAQSANVAVSRVMPYKRADRSRFSWSKTPWFNEVAGLTEHEDPKVRTLAMLAIYRTHDPAAIEYLAGRLDDDAPTFPEPSLLAAPFFPSKSEPIRTPVTPQTVGDVAGRMLTSMLAPSLNNWRLDPKHRSETLETFWKDRKHRTHWIGWFVFELGQATRHQTKELPDTAALIGDVLGQIMRLPPIEHEVALLAVFGSTETRHLIRQANYIAGQDLLRFAAMRLGPDRLLQLLEGEALIDDPDLPKYLLTIQRYIYEHAAVQLRPQDFDRVIELAWRHDRTDAFIAAARLEPSRASEVLREGYRAKQGEYEGGDRARMMTSLWQLAGTDEADFITDWFFQDQTPKLGRIPYRADLLDALLDRFDPADRAMLARIVQDSRIDGLSFPEHMLLAGKLNRNHLAPIIEPEAIVQLYHPMGESHFDGQIEQARRNYPSETAHVERVLARWRDQIRASVPRWDLGAASTVAGEER